MERFYGTTLIPDPESFEQTNCVDWAPDYHIALPFSGLPNAERVDIAWMSNWKYVEHIPTYAWRVAANFPRRITLSTVKSKATLAKEPISEHGNIRYHQTWDTVPGGTTQLNFSGKTIDITLTFSESASTEFGIIVRATPSVSEQTRIGYDFETEHLFIDRTSLGNIEFEP